MADAHPNDNTTFEIRVTRPGFTHTMTCDTEAQARDILAHGTFRGTIELRETRTRLLDI